MQVSPSWSWVPFVKNQVNALVKILVDFSVSTVVYFFVGYSLAYGVHFFSSAEVLAEKNRYEFARFFFLLTFAATIRRLFPVELRNVPSFILTLLPPRYWWALLIRCLKVLPGMVCSGYRHG